MRQAFKSVELKKLFFLFVTSFLLMSTGSCSRSGYGASLTNRNCIYPASNAISGLVELSLENKNNLVSTFGLQIEQGYEFGDFKSKWPSLGHDYLLIKKNDNNKCNYIFLTFAMAEKDEPYAGNYAVSPGHGSLKQMNHDLNKIKILFSPNDESWFSENAIRELKSKSEIVKFLNDNM